MAEMQIDLTKIFEEYKGNITEAVKAAQDTTAKETVEKLKTSSPNGKGKTKKYKDGWAVKREGRQVIVYNKNKPSLTHLLENGHLTKNGGRTRAQKHIKPAEEFASKTFVKKIKEALENA